MEHLKKITKDQNGKKVGAMDVADMNYPTLYVDDHQIPEIKDWEVGKKYRLLIEVAQKSKSEMSVNSGGEEREVIDARFNIVAYKVMKEKTMDEMDDKEFSRYQGKSLEKGKLA